MSRLILPGVILQVERVRESLLEIRELIGGYVDADHNGHCFIPNNAMKAQHLLDEALRILGGGR